MMMDFLTLVQERYSVRKFDSRTVDAAEIEQLLKAALSAPTARNKQPVRILPLHDQQSLRALDACTPCRYGAPLAFVIGYQADACCIRSCDGKSSGDIDASIVTTHVMLMAKSLGIGSLWVMNFQPAQLSESFVLPDGFIPTAILMLGYPASDSLPSPRHAESISEDEILLQVTIK